MALTGYHIVQTKHGVGYIKQWCKDKAFVVLVKPVEIHGKETDRILCKRESLKIIGFYDYETDTIE